jgi:hypothetical protein
MRWVAVAAVLIGATVGYVAVPHQFHVTQTPAGRKFGASRAGEALARICIKPIALDALKYSLYYICAN